MLRTVTLFLNASPASLAAKSAPTSLSSELGTPASLTPVPFSIQPRCPPEGSEKNAAMGLAASARFLAQSAPGKTEPQVGASTGTVPCCDALYARAMMSHCLRSMLTTGLASCT